MDYAEKHDGYAAQGIQWIAVEIVKMSRFWMKINIHHFFKR